MSDTHYTIEWGKHAFIWHCNLERFQKGNQYLFNAIKKRDPECIPLDEMLKGFSETLSANLEDEEFASDIDAIKRQFSGLGFQLSQIQNLAFETEPSITKSIPENSK